MSNTDTLLNGDEPVSTLTQDFHTRLDNLLRTLVHAKPHFVRCIAPNEHDSDLEFDRTHVTNQVRSLQVLETVNLMARGFPHRMRFKAFNSRYVVCGFTSFSTRTISLIRCFSDILIRMSESYKIVRNPTDGAAKF